MGWRDEVIANMKEGQVFQFRGRDWYGRGVDAGPGGVKLSDMSEEQAIRIRALWAERIARRDAAAPPEG